MNQITKDQSTFKEGFNDVCLTEAKQKITITK